MNLDHALIKSLPKVLLHEHLDGVLRPETVIDLAKSAGYDGLPTAPAISAEYFEDESGREATDDDGPSISVINPAPARSETKPVGV